MPADSDRREVSAWLRNLKRDFPVSRRTIVYLRPRGSIIHNESVCNGLFYPVNKSFVILLERSPDISAIIDTLLHEWVHCRIYPDMTHNLRFDLEYGHIRRKYFGE